MRSSTRSAWLAFSVFSLTAVATGCWIARAHGVPAHIWLMNLAAWVVGAGLAAALSRTKTQRWWPVVALAGLAATFVSPGLSGVHRWIGLGPVRLNGAELLLPPTFVARLGTLLPFAILALLALQPDASQAIAFAGGSIVMAAHQRRIWSVLLLAAAAALSFLRHDPLAPVPEVEGIVGLAAAMSPAIAALAVLSLAGAVLAPLLVRSPGALALTAYLALCALGPAFGEFPVPLVGMGVSPILGAWLGFGTLMGLTARSPAPP
jgi:hypothetical protein